jgi:N-acylglucosamine 2-epimerase
MTVSNSFREKHMPQIRALAAYYRKHLLEDIVPFWEERMLDLEYGGYYNCFDREGRLYNDIKCGWFVGRNMYMLSSLYNNIEKRQQWLEAARAGRRFLTEKAMTQSGRLNQMMKRDGSVISGATSIFTDHFAVKGLFEYIEAAGATEDIPLAKSMFDKLMRNVSDRDVLAGECPDVRFRKHAVSFMTLIVSIEGKRLFKDEMKPIIDACLQDSLYTFVDASEKAPLEYVSADGRPLYEDEGRIVDPGHTLESLWFSIKEGMEREDPGIIQRACEIVDWVIDRAWDKEYGGFYQNVDVFDTIPQKPFLSNRYADIDVAWSDKIWWVQAEALYTLALSALLTENERYFEYFLKLHQYCKDYFSDPAYGEWYSILHRDGSVLSDRKGFELKGFYHVPRSVMQLALLFGKYIEADGKLGGYSGKNGIKL